MKIIIKNRVRNHMEAHKGDFLIDYNKLIREFEVTKEAENLNEEFVKIEHDFKKIIGISGVVNVNKDEKIVYAKRIGREIYSKFALNIKEGIKTSKVVFILKKYKYKEYFLVTMFPGEISEKEPEDSNINTIKELKESLSFWKDRAFVWNEKIVDLKTIQVKCPYKELTQMI